MGSLGGPKSSQLGMQAPGSGVPGGVRAPGRVSP